MVQVYSTVGTEDPQHAIVLVVPVATGSAAPTFPPVEPDADVEAIGSAMGSSHAKTAVRHCPSPRRSGARTLRSPTRKAGGGGRQTAASGRHGSRRPRGPVSSPAMQIGVTVQRVDDHRRCLTQRSGAMRQRVRGNVRVPSLGPSSSGDQHIAERSVSSALSEVVSDATALPQLRHVHPTRHRRRNRDHSPSRHRFSLDRGYQRRFRELPQSTSPHGPGRIERYTGPVPIESCGALYDSDGESISSISSSETTEHRNHCVSPRCESRTLETSELPTQRSSQCRSSSHHPLMRQLLSPVPMGGRRSAAFTSNPVDGGHRRAVQSAGNSTRPRGHAEAAAQCSQWELGHRVDHGDYESPPPLHSSDPYATRAARAKAKLIERTCKVFYHRDHPGDDRPELPISFSARQPDKALRKNRCERHVERRLDFEEGDVVNRKSHRRKSWNYGDQQRFTQVYHCVTSKPHEGTAIVQMERSKCKMESSHRRSVAKEQDHEKIRDLEVERVREWEKKSRERRPKVRERVMKRRPGTPSRMRPIDSMDSLPPPPVCKTRSSPCVNPTKSEEELLVQTSRVEKASIFMRHGGAHVKNRSVRSRNKEGRTVKPMSIKELRALRRKQSATQTSDDSEHTGWSDTVKAEEQSAKAKATVALPDPRNDSCVVSSSKSSKARPEEEETRVLNSRTTRVKEMSTRSCAASRASSNASECVDNPNTLSTMKFAASTASADTMCSSTSIPSPSSKHTTTNRRGSAAAGARDATERGTTASGGASTLNKGKHKSRGSTVSSACHTSVLHASLPGGSTPPTESRAHLRSSPPSPPPLPSGDTASALTASAPRPESPPSARTDTPLPPPLDARHDGDGGASPRPSRPATPTPLGSRPLRRPQGAYVRAVAAEFEENIARNMRADSPPLLFLDDSMRLPQARGGRLAAGSEGGGVTWETHRRSLSPSQRSSGVLSSLCESFRSSEVPTCRAAVRLFERKTTRTMEQMDASVYSFRERRMQSALLRSSAPADGNDAVAEGCGSVSPAKKGSCGGCSGGGGGCSDGCCCSGDGCCGSGGGCVGGGGGEGGGGGAGGGKHPACDTAEEASWTEEEPPLPPTPPIRSPTTKTTPSAHSSPLSPSSLPPSMYSPSSAQPPSSPSMPSSPPFPLGSPGSLLSPRSCDAVVSCKFCNGGVGFSPVRYSSCESVVSEPPQSQQSALHRSPASSHRLRSTASAHLLRPPPLPLPPFAPTLLRSTMNGINGLNGHGDHLNGGNELLPSQALPKGCWTIGLINSKYRYLTAETFGFKINANGASLKKKQVWTLEPSSPSGSDSCIFLRSHLGKYLAVDSFGNVTCESEEKDPGSKFQISVADDNTGRWAFRNVTRGYYLGASADKLCCTAKVPGDAEFWHVHLAARPQVNLRSVGRKRFAHLSENLDEIHVDANIPWGEDTLFTLEFRADDSGKYALHTCNNKYLSREGKLVEECGPNCLFSAEYHAGQLALRDRSGAYLSPIGSKAVLKSRSTTVTKDELFSLEDSLPQASFVAALNARYVSVKQGVDVTANQDEISDHETFQLEFDGSTKRWYIRTMQDRYWTLETGGGIQASSDKKSSNALFDLVWQDGGAVAFRANNGKYVATKRSGHLYANCDTVEDNAKYFFYLINRPILVLKCEQGFVGYKSASSPKLECNKATYETIQVERSEKGVVFFKGQNGKYWHVDGESVTADSDTPEGFFLELREPTRICIKSVGGEYLVANKNGAFRLGDTDYENATKWEY